MPRKNHLLKILKQHLGGNTLTSPSLSKQRPIKQASNITSFIFHIIHYGLSAKNLKKLNILAKKLNTIFSIHIKYHKTKQSEFDMLPAWGEYGNWAAYFRLKIGDFLDETDETIEKCLYLDAGMLVVRDIREIFSIDLKNKAIGAVANFFVWSNTVRGRGMIRDLGLMRYLMLGYY